MPNKQCWMLNDECSHSHTLTLSHSHSLDSWFIYERWVRKDECRMINAGCWVPSPTLTLSHSHTQKKIMLSRSQSEQGALHCYVEKDKIEPLPIPTANSALLYRKRQDWTVPNPNREHCHCYIEKDWTEPCSIPTANSALLYRKIQEKPLPLRTESSALIYRKRQNWIVAQSEQRTLHCYIEKDKTEPFLLPNRELCFIMSTKKWRTVAHSNVGFCIVISKQARLNRFPIRIEKSALVYENGKTDPFFLPTDNFALLQ